MIKQAPSRARLAAMLVFTLSCFGLFLFLWLSFGGSIPLKPKGYRFKVAIPEASTLVNEADVRLAGVTVGKVKDRELLPGANRTQVEVELKNKFAPIARDSRVILRQKTLLGESYLELAPGHRSAGMLADGGTLPNSHVEPTVELDEIFNAFDRPTREALQGWTAELNRTFNSGHRPTSQELNDALGNLVGFTGDGARLLETLDEQRTAVRRLIRNTGLVAGSLSRRQGALRHLVTSSDQTFAATSARHEALAQSIAIFPTFLHESRATLARLQRFAHTAGPVVADLRPGARQVAPTLRDLRGLSPDLKGLFRDLDPLIVASKRGLPALDATLRGARPLADALHPFFLELNPILSYLSFNQQAIGAFFSNGLTNLARGTTPTTPWSTQNGIVDQRSFEQQRTRPSYDRGNAYTAPNVYTRGIPLAAIESFTCPGGKNIPDPVDTGDANSAPPCFIQPPSLFQHQQFPRLVKGGAPIVRPPKGAEGTRPAVP